MSLSVYLEGETTQVTCTCQECWNEHTRHETEEFFSANITHNLNGMADAAGIYRQVWRPEEMGITKASQMIGPLESGIKSLKANPARYEKLNPENGWGSYEAFVPWLERYLAACIEYPNATVRASR